MTTIIFKHGGVIYSRQYLQNLTTAMERILDMFPTAELIYARFKPCVTTQLIGEK